MVVFCGLVGLSLSLKQDHDKPASAGPYDKGQEAGWRSFYWMLQEGDAAVY